MQIKKKILASCFGTLMFAVSSPLYAQDLMQVYQDALQSDPTFKQAEANWLATKEELAISKSGTGVAGSGLFPYVDVSGELNRTHRKVETQGNSTSGYYNGNEYFLTITQPIFNYATWKSISSARYTVKAGTATYLAAAQNLMSRVAEAYFNVLSASDTLRYTLAQKRQFLHQLITAEQKFKVGLIAITGVYDAKASYDSSVAEAIADRNALLDQLENLRAITGHYYTSLKALNTNIPLVVPKPGNIEQWVKISLNQNYSIKSAQNTMFADRELIKEAKAGRYPEVTGVAAYGAETTGTVGATTPSIPDTTTTSGYVAVDLDIPIFQGGYVSATAKQAEYNYLAASDALEFTHRDVVNQTRQSFLGVQSGISKIKADQQSIDSARNQLEATEAGYTVGTRTMVDVLDSVTSLYQSQETWSNDRYSYIINTVALKEQAGTLSPHDLKELNGWLAKEEKFNLSPIEANAKYNKVKLPRVKASTSGAKKPYLDHQSKVQGSKKHPLSSAQLSTGSRYYAVQLLADHNEKTARTFIKQQGHLTEELHLVDSRYTGDNWYRVLYGHYKTRGEAEAALKKIPASLKQYRPWVVLMLEPGSKLKQSALTTRARQPAIGPQSKGSTTNHRPVGYSVPSLNPAATDQQVASVSLPEPNQG